MVMEGERVMVRNVASKVMVLGDIIGAPTPSAFTTSGVSINATREPTVWVVVV